MASASWIFLNEEDMACWPASTTGSTSATLLEAGGSLRRALHLPGRELRRLLLDKQPAGPCTHARSPGHLACRCRSASSRRRPNRSALTWTRSISGLAQFAFTDWSRRRGRSSPSASPGSSPSSARGGAPAGRPSRPDAVFS